MTNPWPEKRIEVPPRVSVVDGAIAATTAGVFRVAATGPSNAPDAPRFPAASPNTTTSAPTPTPTPTPLHSHRAAAEDTTFAGARATPFHAHERPWKKPPPTTSITAGDPTTSDGSPGCGPYSRCTTGCCANSTCVGVVVSEPPRATIRSAANPGGPSGARHATPPAPPVAAYAGAADAPPTDCDASKTHHVRTLPFPASHSSGDVAPVAYARSSAPATDPRPLLSSPPVAAAVDDASSSASAAASASSPAAPAEDARAGKTPTPPTTTSPPSLITCTPCPSTPTTPPATGPYTRSAPRAESAAAGETHVNASAADVDAATGPTLPNRHAAAPGEDAKCFPRNVTAVPPPLAIARGSTPVTVIDGGHASNARPPRENPIACEPSSYRTDRVSPPDPPPPVDALLGRSHDASAEETTRAGTATRSSTRQSTLDGERVSPTRWRSAPEIQIGSPPTPPPSAGDSRRTTGARAYANTASVAAFGVCARADDALGAATKPGPRGDA